MDNDVKLGKFISLILRHKPETINLKLTRLKVRQMVGLQMKHYG